MAGRRKGSSKTQSTIRTILGLIFIIILVLGAFGIIDLAAVDDAVEPVLGSRPFMTVPTPTVFGGAASVAEVVDDASGASDWWSVYFTTPGLEENYIAEELISLIDAAQTSIHIASFEFNLDEVAEALIEAHERGVEVQWVTDDEHGIDADEEDGHGQFEMLEDAGIEVIDDHRGALMHNKFWIFDQSIVWTGSTNITHNGTLLNNNNVIVFDSFEIAEIYELEFQEMWTYDEFGPRSPSSVGKQEVTVEGTPVAILFGPEDDVASRLAELLGQAQSEIRFMAFAFTHDDMGGSILDRYRQGVDVAGIFEQRGSETEYSEFPFLHCAGVPVLQDGNSRTFHHKVLVIDRQIVVTGSFNFSRNADESNDENVVILRNPEIAALYLREFDKRWQEAKLAGHEIDFSCP